MTVLTVVLGSGAALAGAVVALYAAWHRRFAVRLERVPVRADRAENLLRRGDSRGHRPE